MLIYELDAQTNTSIEREATEDEKAIKLLDQAQAKVKADEVAAHEAAKTALLTKLGITADEAALLLA